MEVKPIGDRKHKAERSKDFLSPSVKSSRKTARFDTFPEGDGENVKFYLPVGKCLDKPTKKINERKIKG